MIHSLAFSIMQDLKEDVGAEVHKRFLKERCLGVLTKVDKELESNSEKGATEYDRDTATKLRDSLLCAEHPRHIDKWPWVAVLNPNAEEQLQVRGRLCPSLVPQQLRMLLHAVAHPREKRREVHRHGLQYNLAGLQVSVRYF